MLRLPRISPPDAQGRADSAGMLLLGGIATFATGFARPVHPFVLLVGAGLLGAAAYRWIEAARCPACSDSWVWRALMEASLARSPRWLAELQTCPACGFAPAADLLVAQPAVTPDLQRALDDARDLAEREGAQRIGARHLLVALLRCESLIAFLRTLDVDRARLQQQAAQLASAHPTEHGSPPASPLEFADDLKHCLDDAAIHVFSSEVSRITPALVLLTFVSQAAPEPVREILRTSGLSEYRMKVCIAHGTASLGDPGEATGTVHVIFHDDPFTTREFVLDVLTSVFEKRPDDAEALMLAVHDSGSQCVATLPAEQAMQRIRELRARALAQRYPLRVSMEAPPTHTT